MHVRILPELEMQCQASPRLDPRISDSLKRPHACGTSHRGVRRYTGYTRGSARKAGSSGMDCDIWATFCMLARPLEVSAFLLRVPPLEM